MVKISFVETAMIVLDARLKELIAATEWFKNFELCPRDW